MEGISQCWLCTKCTSRHAQGQWEKCEVQYNMQHNWVAYFWHKAVITAQECTLTFLSLGTELTRYAPYSGTREHNPDLCFF